MKKAEKVLEKYINKEKELKKIVEEVLKKHDVFDEKILKKTLKFFETVKIEKEDVEKFFEKDSKLKEKEVAVKLVEKVLEEDIKLYKELFEKAKKAEEIAKEKDYLENRVKTLEDNLKKLEKEKEEYKDLSLRLKKDYENLTKRVEKEKKLIEENASKKICKAIIEILDNFQNAINSIEKQENLEKEKVLEGLKLIEKKFLNILEKEGVKAMETVNNKFDHNLHDALATEEVEGLEEDDIILEEFRKGYYFKDEVLRHALVKVGKKVSKEKNK